MPGASFCGECGIAVLAAGSEPNPAGEFARTDDPSGYTPSTLASDGTAIPGEIAGMGARTGAWLVTCVVAYIISTIPIIGGIVSLGVFIWSLFLIRRGQDFGARIVGLRVVRDTGELAGFYHMWTRGLASIISFIVLGAGYWTAYSANDNRTWHDKWLGTYVVKAGPEVDTLPGTSSSAAKICFWISSIFGAMLLMLFIAAIVVFVGGVMDK